MPCRLAALAIACAAVVACGKNKPTPGGDGTGAPPAGSGTAATGGDAAAPDASAPPTLDAATADAAAPTGSPIRIPVIDCEEAIPAKLIRTHVKRGRLEAIEGGCRIDRGTEPFAIFHVRCAPAGTPRWAGAVPPWKDAVAAAAPPLAAPYRMSETSLFGHDTPCLMVGMATDLAFPKFQALTADVHEALAPVLAAPTPTE